MGYVAPDCTLVGLNGESKSLHKDFLNTDIPIVITMGSYSWPPFVRNRVAIVDMFNKYGTGDNKVANFLTIYIEEAHAKDDWSLPPGVNPGGEHITMHKTIGDRLAASRKFVDDFLYPVEMVCDNMMCEAMDRYEASPERLYVIERGIVVYKGGQGPFHYKPDEVRAWLVQRFGPRE